MIFSACFFPPVSSGVFHFRMGRKNESNHIQLNLMFCILISSCPTDVEIDMHIREMN